MRTIAPLLLLFGFSTLAAAADAKYALTGDNTTIEWIGKKKAGKHEGGFKKLSGNATVSEKGAIAFSLEIDCDSLYSDNAQLTGHLKNADFFNVKANPTAKFVTKKIEKNDKTHTVTGDLTLLGTTKEIKFPAEIDTEKGLSVKATFTINRMDFGMKYGKGQVDDEVTITAKIAAK